MSIDIATETARSRFNHIWYLSVVEIKKATINNKVKAIEQIFELDPVS